LAGPKFFHDSASLELGTRPARGGPLAEAQEGPKLTRSCPGSKNVFRLAFGRCDPRTTAFFLRCNKWGFYCLLEASRERASAVLVMVPGISSSCAAQNFPVIRPGTALPWQAVVMVSAGPFRPRRGNSFPGVRAQSGCARFREDGPLLLLTSPLH